MGGEIVLWRMVESAGLGNLEGLVVLLFKEGSSCFLLGKVLLRTIGNDACDCDFSPNDL